MFGDFNEIHNLKHNFYLWSWSLYSTCHGGFGGTRLETVSLRTNNFVHLDQQSPGSSGIARETHETSYLFYTFDSLPLQTRGLLEVSGVAEVSSGDDALPKSSMRHW